VVRDIIAAQRDGGACVILTTHELSEAERLADRVVIIDRGRTLAEGTPAELASGTGDGSIRFSTEPGIDVGALALTIGAGTTVIEQRPGTYRLRSPAGASLPGVVAALADLRTGQSLEEAYLAITGSREAAALASDPPGRRRSRRGRRPVLPPR
jgi:ABC-2 type transport system ATP-binding protein